MKQVIKDKIVEAAEKAFKSGDFISSDFPSIELEKTKKLEQLRAIENGFGILTAKVSHTCDGIDTKQQYDEFVKRYIAAKQK